MLNIRALAVAFLLPCAALAQSSPNWTQGYVPMPKEWNDRWADKADSARLDAEIARATALSAHDVVFAAARGIVCNGTTDIGPAMQALDATLGNGTPAVVQMPPGVCLWNTAVTTNHALHLRGYGSPEAGGAAMGTTLRTTNPSITPLTFTSLAAGNGTSVSGAIVSDLTLEQAHPSPAGGWAPTIYAPFFRLQGAPGVRFRNIVGKGIYAGINSSGSGRLDVQGLKGQFFSYAVLDDNALDADRFTDFHIWPFWSEDASVMAWQQANSDALRLLRVDTPYVDRFFALGVRSGIRLDAGSNGSTTKLQIGTASFDYTQTGIWVPTAVTATVQIGSLTSQGQAWGSNPPAAVPGASAIRVDNGGSAIIQVANLESEFAETSIVSLLNTSARTVLHIGSVFARSIPAGNGQTLFTAAAISSNPPHEIRLGMVPLTSAAAYLPMLNYAGTNAILRAPELPAQVVYGAVSQTAPYAITNAQPNLVMEPDTQGAVPALYLSMPGNPYDGEEVSMTITQPLNMLYCSAPFATVLGCGGPIAAYQAARFKYFYQAGVGGVWVKQ